jgi:PPP family 3-phenylpropionic acid transporter
MLITILLNMFFAPVSSFADSATMFMLVDKKEMYGRVRLGGTFGFGLAAPIAGRLVQNYGLKLAFWGGATLMFLAFVVSPKLVYRQSKAGAATGGSVLTLLKNRRWVFFLAVAFAGGLTLAVTNNYLFPYLKELGANETTMGLALAIGTIGEIPVLFFGNQLIQRLKPYGLLMLAMVVSGIRLLLLAASSTPNLVMLLQLFAGLTFPAMWVAGVSYADDNAPAGMGATAQGLFGAMVFGFGMAMGGFLGGLLLANLGGQGMYLVVGVIVLAIVALSWIGERLLAERPAAP